MVASRGKVDRSQVGSGRVERTHMILFTFDETTGGSRDMGSPVTNDYPVGNNAFTGTVECVTLRVVCPQMGSKCVRKQAQVDEPKTAGIRAFGPKECPQVQIGRDSVSVKCISTSTHIATIRKAKAFHTSPQAASHLWKQSVSTLHWLT